MNEQKLTRATAEKAHDHIVLRLTGPNVAQYNAKLIEECANELFACADRNACLADGLKLTEACFTTLARHNEAIQCLPQGFGFNLHQKG